MRGKHARETAHLEMKFITKEYRRHPHETYLRTDHRTGQKNCAHRSLEQADAACVRMSFGQPPPQALHSEVARRQQAAVTRLTNTTGDLFRHQVEIKSKPTDVVSKP